MKQSMQVAERISKGRKKSRKDISQFTSTRHVNDVIALLESVRVPAGRVYTAADIANDPQYQARDMLVETTAYDGEPLTQPGIVPKLSGTPGAIWQRAPTLGEHTQQVLEQAGFTAEQLADLQTKGVIR